MAVSIAILEQGVVTGDTFNTGSITWSGGVGIVCVMSAYVADSGNTHVVTHTATKGTDTWTTQVDNSYGYRRGMSFITNLAPTDGVITIDPATNLAKAFLDGVYFICEISGSDGAVPANFNSDGGTSADSGPRTVTLTDAIGVGDLAIFFGASENTAGHAVDGIVLAETSPNSIQTSTNTRSGLIGKTTSDTTPGHTWTGTNHNGAIACVFKVAVGGGVNIAAPSKSFNLADQIPVIGGGVGITTVKKDFNLTDFIPRAGTSVVIATVKKDFNLSDQIPIVGTSVNIQQVKKDFNLADQIPAVVAGGGINIQPTGQEFYLNAGPIVTFDGSNDYLSRAGDLIGNADSKLATIFVVLRIGAVGTSQQIIRNNSGGIEFQFNSLDKLNIVCRLAGSTKLSMSSSVVYSVGDFLTCLICVDMTNNLKTVMYVNDADVTSLGVHTDSLLAFTDTNHGLLSGPSGLEKFLGDVLAVWYAPGVFIDFTVTSNRRKFISSGNIPQNLGLDGSPPNGTAPLVYYRGNAVEWNGGVNRGSGGDYTMQGAVVDLASGPLFIPGVNDSVSINTLSKTFNLTDFIPQVGTSVSINVTKKDFNITGFIPQVGTSVNIILTNNVFNLTKFNPIVSTGVNIIQAARVFNLTDFIPSVATGGPNIQPSSKMFNLADTPPVINIILNIQPSGKQFNLADFVPVVHSVIEAFRSTQLIDPNAPSLTTQEVRYFYDNFAILQDILGSGVTGQFTTTDGKTIHIRNGIVVDIF